MPSDKLGHKVAQLIQQPGVVRDRLTEGMYLPDDENETLGRYEKALRLVKEAEPVYKKLHVAARKKELPKIEPRFVIEEAVEKGILSSEEASLIRKAEEWRVDVVQVDEFTLEEYRNLTPTTPGFRDI